METALGAANWLLGKVLQKLSDDLVAAYVASSELRPNFDQIKTQLNYTHALLHAAQERDVNNNPGLRGLLEDLSKKADEAEDALDELHYFIIQDQLDGTQEATPEVAGGLHGHALHGRHAVRHTIGNWLPCFSCSRMQDDDAADTNGGHVDKLLFDRVAMSNKIKLVIEGIHSKCAPVSDLLKISPSGGLPASMVATLERPTIGSAVTQHKLYGRGPIFNQTINDMTSGTYHSETLSVLPIVGLGGIGKTTFVQHLYNDKRTKEHFPIRVWVCVSNNFDVLKLTQEILSCVLAAENEGSNQANKTTNLDQLQNSIAERLKSKRFLIVLDDIWKCSEDKWESLLAPFSKGEAEKGSMVLVTTRFPYIAQMVKTTNPTNLQGLEPGDFWEFFQACVFGGVKSEHEKDELIDIAREIGNKLKCSPLAAKTVGRLLKKDLSRKRWMEILEKKEWRNQKHDNDIMPALKISYDYLPFHLKKCFSYCSLFPEDHRFYNLEISCFLVAIGLIDSSGQNDHNYLEELVDNGFLIEGGDILHQYYVMHDLLHELSQCVSSQECVNISSSSFRADDIPPSIRHLSITTQDIYDENFLKEMVKLKGVIHIGNLRTSMIFGEYNSANIANIIKDTFNGIKGLRVLFIFMYSLESLPHNFSELIHLRYLKIGSPLGLEQSLPSIISRFYHLKFMDLEQWHGSYYLPEDISRLVNLRHFLARNQIHSNVPEVGKMKYLQELKEFHVKKESVGFELRELGKLTELGGELTIRNLENVRTWEEASEAKLVKKKDLDKLVLVWSRGKPTIGSDVIDGLEPPHNLRRLRIVNHGVDIGPSWLCHDICINMLEVLCLEGVSWGTLPPFGQLPHLTKLILKNIAGLHQFGPDFGGVTDKSFEKLKTVEFEDMRELVKWIGGSNCRLFSSLKSIRCKNCPNLSALPFSECSGPSTQDMNAIWFPNLCSLDIYHCSKLSLPAMPHSSTLTYICVYECGGLKLSYYKKELLIKRYNGALAFHNLDKVEDMEIGYASHISLTDLEKLNYLRRLSVEGCDSLILDGGGLRELTSLQSLVIRNCGKLFSRWSMGEAQNIKPLPPSLSELHIFGESRMASMALLSNLTSLTGLSLVDCDNLTMDGFDPLITVKLKKLTVYNYSREGNRQRSIAADLLSEVARTKTTPACLSQLEELEVDSISAVLVSPICSLLSATLHTLRFQYDERAQSFTEEQEHALQLLTFLQDLRFYFCPSLQSLPEGLHCLSSLEELVIWDCTADLEDQAKKLKEKKPYLQVRMR